jgi:ActR/RegA family two-component response regulator
MVSATQDETGRLRLLLVDDEVGFTTVMAKRLTRRNMEVTAPPEPRNSGPSAKQVDWPSWI